MSIAGPQSSAFASAVPTVAQLRHIRRVLIVSAPSAQDTALRRQMQLLALWKDRGEARDITVVSIVGKRVKGAGDTASALRGRFGLTSHAFAVALIGKDGHLAVKGTTPLPTSELERTIDAMPMRQAGGR